MQGRGLGVKNGTPSGKHLSEATARRDKAFGEGKVNLRLRRQGNGLRKEGNGRRGFQNERLEGSVAEPGSAWTGARL